jgi:drug/metabolite transporter (DMT)-like permease
MALSTLGFSFTHALARIAGEELHAFEIVFFRNFFGVIVLLPWFVRHGLGPLRTKRHGLHALRVAMDFIALAAFYVALGLSPLARVTALGFTAPLFATVLAAVFLGERFGVRRSAAILIGFAGTVLAVRPTFDGIDPGAGLMLIASVLSGGVILAMKSLTRTDSSLTITCYFVVWSIPLSLVLAVPVWTWPSPMMLLVLAALGMLTTGFMVMFTVALAQAEIHVVMPIDYLRLIWAAGIGWILFDEQPDAFTWVGGSVIVSATSYIAYREHMLARAASSRTAS